MLPYPVMNGYGPQNSLYAGNLAGERFARDCILRQLFRINQLQAPELPKDFGTRRFATVPRTNVTDTNTPKSDNHRST
jgi:hypothetical protein